MSDKKKKKKKKKNHYYYYTTPQKYKNYQSPNEHGRVRSGQVK